MNTFSVLPVQYIIHLGVLYRRVAWRIFFTKKTLFFTSEYVIYTERQWLSNLFCYCKICKHLFLQSAILQFQFYSLNFLPIFGNKFFDNCKCHIYIICSKNWMKIRLHLMSLRAIKLC